MESKTVCSNTCRIEETHKSCQGRTVICFLSHLFVWPEILCWRINTVEYLCKYTQLTMWNTFPNIHGNVYEWKNYAEISQCFAPQSIYLLIPFPINFLRALYIFQLRFKCKFLCLLHYQSQWMGISCSSLDAQMPYQSAWNYVSALPLILAPANTCPESQQMLAQVLLSTIRVRDLDWVPHSWLWPSPTPAVAGFWGMDHCMEEH